MLIRGSRPAGSPAEPSGPAARRRCLKRFAARRIQTSTSPGPADFAVSFPPETLLGRGPADPSPLRRSRAGVAAIAFGEERVGPRRFDRGQRPDLPQIVALRALPRSGRLDRPLFRRRLAVVVLHRRILLRSSAVVSHRKHPLSRGSRPLINLRSCSHRRPAARRRRRTDSFQREG